MNNSDLKKVYNRIKSLAKVYWYPSPDKPKELRQKADDILEEGEMVVALTEKSFPENFSIKFEDLPDILTELDKRGFIRFDKNWYNNPKNETTFRVIFIKFVDADNEFKDDEASRENNQQINTKKDNLLLVKNPIAEITIGKLSSYSDGTIKYGNKILKLRNQIKDLSPLFMGNPERLLTIDDIKQELIRASKRPEIPNATISKYVSELHNSLKIHFKKDVIINQKEEGWYFKP